MTQSFDLFAVISLKVTDERFIKPSKDDRYEANVEEGFVELTDNMLAYNLDITLEASSPAEAIVKVEEIIKEYTQLKSWHMYDYADEDLKYMSVEYLNHMIRFYDEKLNDREYYLC